MNYKLFKSSIEDNSFAEKLNNKIKWEEYDKNKVYDVFASYYNSELEYEMFNENALYEIKKEHYQFIKNVRDLFLKNDVDISKFYLMGTVVDIDKNEINIKVSKSLNKKKSNIIWPCKEVFIFEDSKNKLDDMLLKNQITEEDYEYKLDYLKDELSINDLEEEKKYLN